MESQARVQPESNRRESSKRLASLLEKLFASAQRAKTQTAQAPETKPQWDDSHAL
jgi:hypothetical protein